MNVIASGVPRWLVWSLAVSTAGCGHTTQHEDGGDSGNVAGRPSNEAGAASNGAASSGGVADGSTAGSSAANGGNLNGRAGENGAAGAGHVVGVPLHDTALCNNTFVRVEQLPEAPLFFTGTFDGEPVEAFDSTDATRPPTVTVFRFGAGHVEAISLPFSLSASYSGLIEVTALSCNPSGNLYPTAGVAFGYFQLASGKISTVTHSLDGFSGLTEGTIVATWANDRGEQHVLDARFTLRAMMDDALAESF